jgi:putative CocE/NonD family hydrolase
MSTFGAYQPAPPRYRGMVRSSFYITMRDGVKLALTLTLPKNLPAGERIPCLLSQTRYWRDYELYPPLDWLINPEQMLPRQRNFKPFFTGQGYALAALDVRGTGASFGSWPSPWHPDSVEDARQVVDWIIEQPWSNGSVGGYGISYVGTTAELLAALEHPAVKAVIPMFSHPDPYTDLAYPGGAFNQRFVEAWDRLSSAMDHNRVTPELGWRARLFLRGVRPVDEDRHRNLLRQALQAHMGNANILKLAEMIACRDEQIGELSGGVDDISMYRYLNELERSGTAIFGWGSWMDAGTADAVLRRFNTLPNAQRAVIGAWEHGGVLNASPYLEERLKLRIAEASPPPPAQWAEMLQFFDAYLQQDESPLRSDRVLHYYSLGDHQWKRTSAWPPPGTVIQRWRLSSERRLLRQPPVDESGVDTYAVGWNASTGASSRWWELGGALSKPVSYPGRDKAGNHLLTYTTPALEKDLEIAGYPVVTLYLSSSEDDGVVFVYLEDEHPGGRVTYLTEGQLRLIHRKISTEKPRYNLQVPYHTFKRQDVLPLAPGEVVEVSFGLLPVAALVSKGHRLRLGIAGHDAGAFAPIPDTRREVLLSLFRDGSHPSCIEIPVAG